MKDLTQGNPSKALWQFSIPMFISVIFQQLYSIADSAIAGKFAGESALAAVGASYPITMIFIAVAVGSNIGCAVVISQFFGAKDYHRVKTAATTTLISSVVLAILLTVLGIVFCHPLMRMIKTPSDIFGDGAAYLNIYIAGLVFLFVYNVCTGIFTSLGDSKTPLIFLIGSSVGNVVLDLLFVAVFDYGVRGVAWATFIAQGVACILAVITIFIKLKAIETDTSCPLFSGIMLKKIAMYAVPSILQQSFVSVGNIFIQSLVNSFGSSVIAGYSAAIKLNTFTITSFATLGNGLSSFVAQNYGAGEIKRIHKGFKAGVIMGMAVALPFVVLFFVFGNAMISIFMESSSSSEAVETGRLFLRIVSPFYFFVALKLMADGVLRGIGAMKCFMATTFSDLILRVVLAFVLSAPYKSTGIWLSWPLGWVVAMGLSITFYIKQMKRISK